ncbi:ComF family protein [Burkholderia cenocepacia]|uniref:ComF family protein n=1 Tax=Burkholderia cenocepacia TaxID=95486 RepID=UPI001D109965|nr:phosphoribosyltransferase family protein [Burkholderia cenocepacia]
MGANMGYVPQVQQIANLVEYHNYWIDDGQGNRVVNPAFDGNCRMLLDLKRDTERGHNAAVTYFSREVEAFLAAHGVPPPNLQVLIAIVPSSKQGTWGAGLEKIASNLIRRNANFVDATRVLERATTIQKLAAGGNRNQAVHQASIRIGNGGSKIAQKTILLLDDITTTGNSLIACADLLCRAGAATVMPLALGRTT